MSIPIPDCYWVVDRQFLAGEYPGASDAQHARDKLERFLDHGVTLFIDLTEEWELNDYADLARELGATRGVKVAHERFPIQDMSIPTEHHMRAILSRIKAAAHAGETCYVHCWGGVGRTGTVVGCWLAQETGQRRGGHRPDCAVAVRHAGRMEALAGNGRAARVHRNVGAPPGGVGHGDLMQRW